MSQESRFDFETHDDWLAYAAAEVPSRDRPYALASARTELFLRFYQSQGVPLPNRFAEEFKRVVLHHDPERTVELEALNAAIFRDLTAHLFNHTQQEHSASDQEEFVSPQEQIRALLDHLAQDNPYFALWSAYKSSLDDSRTEEDWRDFVAQNLGYSSDEDIEFTQAMAELDALLRQFCDRRRHLPALSFERIRFLHGLRGPERMAQTRAVLGTLTAELSACTSA